MQRCLRRLKPGRWIRNSKCDSSDREGGAILVRVKSAGPEAARLPDAVFSFRCGDPQYAYWLRRLTEHAEGS